MKAPFHLKEKFDSHLYEIIIVTALVNCFTYCITNFGLKARLQRINLSFS